SELDHRRPSGPASTRARSFDKDRSFKRPISRDQIIDNGHQSVSGRPPFHDGSDLQSDHRV
ncbi:MAG: hypothetical protein ACRELF_29505, partial [Gemmataceae bacterium]